MLMAPGPSSRTAGATGSRLPVGADEKSGPKVHPRAIVASEKAQVADENDCSASTVCCHITAHKNRSQRYESMLCEHRATRVDEVRRRERHLRRRHNLLEHIDGVRDRSDAEDERQRHSALRGYDADSAPAAQPEKSCPPGAQAVRPFPSRRQRRDRRGGGPLQKSRIRYRKRHAVRRFEFLLRC